MKINSSVDIPFVKVNQFDKPRTDVKSVLCFYHGKFPKITRPDKDVTLPHRLFPNAKLFIRCNTNNEQTKQYLQTLFKGKAEIELLPENLDCSKIDADVLYMQQDCWLFFGGIVEKQCVNNALIMQSWTKEAYIFYNDESLGTLASLHEILGLRKNSGKFFERNKQAYNTVKEKCDWANVHVIANENTFSNWMSERVSTDLKQKQIQCDYLANTILYDLSKPDTTKDYTRKKYSWDSWGVFIGSFHTTRTKAWNKIFTTPNTVDIEVHGNGSDKLKFHPGNGEYVVNSSIAELYKAHGWSLYIGKGTQSLYLGATFFEPLMNGCPIFVWEGTDTEHKLFPGVKCYFSTEYELAALIETTDFDKLLEIQLQEIFK